MNNNVSTANGLKANANRVVESHRNELIELSLKIHTNPELAFNEKKALTWLVGSLEKNGFHIARGIGGLSTAFKATYGSGKPLIALIAEYDALPELGHACGHNIIAASAIGAGIASKCAIDKYGGTIAIVGTPAEELFGGKVTMLEAGVFDGVDVAMVVHPGVTDMVTIKALACLSLDIEYFGKAAHAAAHPEQGINALEAMILAFNAINSLRQHIQNTAPIHGIITYGGEAANIVPSYAAGKILVRAADNIYLNELKEKVLNCFTGAALASGAKLNYKLQDVIYDAMNNNLFLAQLFAKNLESLGRKVESCNSSFSFGSTDMGNISQVIPAIHPSMAIASPKISLHSTEFAQAAASEMGHKGLTDAAKAMAMTVIDLLGVPDTLTKVKEEFSIGHNKNSLNHR